MWEQKYIETPRGRFELFTCGKGEPLCVTHLYSEFNERGYYFADAFAGNFKVYLVNLKEAGHSCKVNHNAELSMSEAANDLEAIREAVGLKQWAFAGHSTGGMLGLVYAMLFPGSLSKLMTGGAAARRGYMEHGGSMYCPSSPLNKRLIEIFTILKSPDAAIEEKRAASGIGAICLFMIHRSGMNISASHQAARLCKKDWSISLFGNCRILICLGNSRILLHQPSCMAEGMMRSVPLYFRKKYMKALEMLSYLYLKKAIICLI